MVKLEQALILEPPTELHFKAPFSDVTSYLKLHNPTERQICFKLKTTAPKTYFVRPNNGIIQPKTTVTVAVILQSLDFETTDKNKHKFMVQSIFVPDGEVNQEALWSEAQPGSFMNSKLKCVFDIDSPEPQANLDGSGDNLKSDRTTQEEKNDKTHSSVSGPSKDILKTDLKKLQDEQRELRALMIDLKQENSLLKSDQILQIVRNRYGFCSWITELRTGPEKLRNEESLRFRLSCIPDSAADLAQQAKAPLSAIPTKAPHSQMQHTDQDLLTMYNCATYILAFIIGILIGHFF